MNRWELLLIQTVVMPLLDSVANILEDRAALTPNKTDDILAGTFRVALAALKDPALLFADRRKDGGG